VIFRLVRVLLPTSPPGGNSDTVLWSKLPAPRAGFVGRLSLVKMGREEKSLKSAWNDTSPPDRGGKEPGARMLMSIACTLVKVMSTLLDAPNPAGSWIVAA